MRWQSVNNSIGGCMGMCQERAFYRLQVLKEVPGQDRFVTVRNMPDQYNTNDVRMRPCVFTLNELCNNDRQARIRFDLSTAAGVDIHSAITTVADLEAGKTTLNAGNGCTAVLDNFTIQEKPTFIDYLRAGW